MEKNTKYILGGLALAIVVLVAILYSSGTLFRGMVVPTMPAPEIKEEMVAMEEKPAPATLSCKMSAAIIFYSQNGTITANCKQGEAAETTSVIIKGEYLYDENVGIPANVIAKPLSPTMKGKSFTVMWDGKDGNGNELEPGLYTFLVSTKLPNHKRDIMTYYPRIADETDPGLVPITTPPAPPVEEAEEEIAMMEEEPIKEEIIEEDEEEPKPAAPACGGFTDVSANDPDCAAFAYVKSIGAMTGNPDGTLGPQNLVQRDQIAKIVAATFGLFKEGTDYCQGANPFPDVTAEAWSYQYICRGKSIGMIKGYPDGQYRPSQEVNRVEALALLGRNLAGPMPSGPSYSDVTADAWYAVEGLAKLSYDNALFPGTQLFPAKSTTRREVARIIYTLNQKGFF